MERIRKRVLFFAVTLATVVLAYSSPGRTQEIIRVPLERYSISPYLQESFLFLQGTTLPDMIKLDISLGMKYMRQPWRVYQNANSDYLQAPVEDHFQIRPALSFAYRNWFDVALVVPLSYQTAGQTDLFPTTISGQDGFHLLDLEFFIKVPVLHRRVSGFGLAGIAQMMLPTGRTQDAFVGYNVWQGAFIVAADWRWEGFGIMLNTGFLLRDSNTALNTSIGHEWLIRPGISYRLPLGSYTLAFSAEGNIATGLDSFFSEANENAFQMLVSVQLQPTDDNKGFYAAVGGGSRMQGGGYGVPVANVDGRLGYSIQWKTGRPGGHIDPETGEEIPDGEWEKPSGPDKVAVTPDAETPEDVGTIPEEVPDTDIGTTAPGEQPDGTSVAIAPVPPRPEDVAPVEAGMQLEQGTRLIKVEFAPSEPVELADGISSGSAAIPESARNQLRSQRDQIARQLQNPNARLIIVGFADKCFDGPPFLGNQYNVDLSRRRADAMLDLVREIMGSELSGVELRTVAMGRKCANPKCRCSTPEMPECAADRRVELIIDQGEIDDIQCPAGEYWLAR